MSNLRASAPGGTPVEDPLSLLVVGLLAGCGDFSDPPKDPSIAPLEIVANDQGRAACELNRTDITEGTHEVVAITQGADAVVVGSNRLHVAP
jgi:hypothetical protein